MIIDFVTEKGNKYTLHDVEYIEQKDGYTTIYLKPPYIRATTVPSTMIKDFLIRQEK